MIEFFHFHFSKRSRRQAWWRKETQLVTMNLTPDHQVDLGKSEQPGVVHWVLLLVRAECVRQRNDVAIKLGIIFLSSLPSSAKSPRESCRRVPKFCMGS